MLCSLDWLLLICCYLHWGAMKRTYARTHGHITKSPLLYPSPLPRHPSVTSFIPPSGSPLHLSVLIWPPHPSPSSDLPLLSLSLPHTIVPLLFFQPCQSLPLCVTPVTPPLSPSLSSISSLSFYPLYLHPSIHSPLSVLYLSFTSSPASSLHFPFMSLSPPSHLPPSSAFLYPAVLSLSVPPSFYVFEHVEDTLKTWR